MSEESTKKLANRVSFEQRVFARFDSIDARLEKLESRSYDTKPIWEKALAVIVETGLEVGELKTKVEAIETKVDVIETKVEAIETKVDVIESKVDVIESRVGSLERDVAALKNDYSNLHNELVESQRDFKVKLTRRIDLVLEVMIDNRDGWRAADERLNRLESKLA
jgi:predicted  nucleic acid-binding Zn-ribbon protein